ncbi:MAG TPA: iduronate-2-sulfatase, partial [Bacteroidetes bacterium]|nr:iduronate-2-sulfatase [Bacteroidota bacterium]HEX04106.1 iduronate-2-sulfatase [Bacteroidota bacterium]
MNRRKFVNLALGGSAALALTSPYLRAQPTNPNVIFVFMDDLNDWVGCLGHPQAITPNIDAFAASGVNFTNAHANATECIPSRCSLFASRRPSSTGVYSNNPDWPLRMPDAFWMPENFTQNGYLTFRAGKFFHPSYNDIWDDFCPMNPAAKPPNFPISGQPFSTDYYKYFDWAPVDVPDDNMRSGRYANWAIQKLQETHSDPFFLPIGFTSTHDAWHIPRRYFEPFPLESIELPDVPEDEWDDIPEFARNRYLNPVYHQTVVKQQQWRKAVQAYLA